MKSVNKLILIYRKIKESIHYLNSISPFKDAYKTNSPNFILDDKREEDKNQQVRQKAKPPMLNNPLSVILKLNEQGNILRINTIELELTLEGNIAVLQNEEGHRQNTSFDSMGTDQIFMTYTEKEHNGKDTQQELKQTHILIDQEIDQIKENLRMPTIETEEDEQMKTEQHKLTTAFEYQENTDKNVREKVDKLLNPLTRKLCLMEYDNKADIVEAKHLN